MIKNVGKIDRLVRIVVGLALLSMLIFAGGNWKWLAGLAGLVLLGTAVVGWCPAYGALGIKTCPTEDRR
jgi:hypothetical protein